MEIKRVAAVTGGLIVAGAVAGGIASALAVAGVSLVSQGSMGIYRDPSAIVVGGIMGAIAGAVLAGASKVIAVDLDPEKLEQAKKFGATHTIPAGDKSEEEVIEAVRELTDGFGTDVAIDAVAIPTTTRQAFYSRDLAGRMFGQIAKADDVPESIRQRAVQMAGLLGVDAAPSAGTPTS